MKYTGLLLLVIVFCVIFVFVGCSILPTSQREEAENGADDSQSNKVPLQNTIKDYSTFATGTPLFNDISVSANSAILCTDDGTLLFEKNADVPLPMASITKVMSAIVALEMITDLSELVCVDNRAVGIEGSSVYLNAGEAVTYEMLLYSSLLESANDATTALAIAVSGSVEDFVLEMNRKAQQLSMSSTHFCNPHGLNENEHFTTARDYARLMAYALDDPTFCSIIATKKAVFQKSDKSMYRVLTNHNRLLNTYKGMLGGKTGFTKASGRTLVTAACRNETTLICVTLNASNDWNDHTLMLDRGFNAVKSVAFDREMLLETVNVAAGSSDTVAVKLAQTVKFTLKANEQVTYSLTLPHILFAPVKAGQVVGRAEFYNGENLLKTVDLIAAKDVDEPEIEREKTSIFARIISFFKQKE